MTIRAQNPSVTIKKSSRLTYEMSKFLLQMCVRYRLFTQYLTLDKYRGWNPNEAVQDYYGRIHLREQAYETIEETDWPYIRIFNVSLIHAFVLLSSLLFRWAKKL